MLGALCMGSLQIHAEEVNIPFQEIFKKHSLQFVHIDQKNPKLLIMFSGTPGMGKTTLACALEKDFQAIRLSTDEARSFLHMSGLQLSFADKYISYCLDTLHAKSNNQTFILDRSIDRTYPDYMEFAKRHGYITFVVRVQAGRPVVEERIKRRGRDVESLLQKLDRLFCDYAKFTKRRSTDFVFDTESDFESQYTQLLQVIYEKMEPKRKFSRLLPHMKEYHAIRTAILTSEQVKTIIDKVDKERCFHEIIPGLYLGSQEAMDNHLHEIKISHVLSCRSAFGKPPEITEGNWKKIQLADLPDQNISKYFNESYEFIENSENGCLVHCQQGISRSATVVIAYLMKKFHVPYMAAHSYVKKLRPQVAPNSGFIKQLLEYEAELQKEFKANENSLEMR